MAFIGSSLADRRWTIACRIRALGFGLLASVVSTAHAQDSHYWSSQFGNRARLLGGAVVGSATDLSAIYYNPGALALVERPELLLAGTVFQYENLNVSEALGAGNLSDSRFSLSPSLFAGEIRFEALGDYRLGYALLTRQESEFRLNQRAEITEELAPQLPGLRFASGGIQFETRLKEYWFGGSVARKLGDRIGIGISPFIAIRNHRGRDQVLTQGLGADGQGGIAMTSRDFDYQHWRLLAKLGASTTWDRWKLGVTLTTPSLGLFGSGTTGYDQSAVGQDIDLDGSATAEIATDFQEGVSSSYHSPFSIAFGGARSFGPTRLHVSAEWFDGVGPDAILEPEPFQAQSSGETIRYDVVYELDSVFNAAIGLEHRLASGVQLYGAFNTDFSAAPADSDSNSTVSSWDLFHLSGGATLEVVQQEITLGLIYAFGSSRVGDNLLGLDPDLGVSYRRLTFILGVNFVFGS